LAAGSSIDKATNNMIVTSFACLDWEHIATDTIVRGRTVATRVLINNYKLWVEHLMDNLFKVTGIFDYFG